MNAERAVHRQSLSGEADEITFAADDFSPLHRDGDGQTTLLTMDEQLSERGYWAQVWRRFKRHPLALLALLCLTFIFGFSLFGPLLWTVAPHTQNLSEVSQSPRLARQALVIDSSDKWQIVLPVSAERSDQNLLSVQSPSEFVAVEANTERVRLRWQPVVFAREYRVFRNDHPPDNRWDLGLPLARIIQPGQVSYEDRLKLGVQDYYYSVVAVAQTSSGLLESHDYALLRVKPEPAVSLFDLQLSGMDAMMRAHDNQRYIDLPAHPLGTDYLGRDMLARLIHGSRTSLFIGIVGPLLIVLIGGVYGAVAAYFGGRVDELMMRFADFVIALPFLLFMILFKVILGVGPGNSGVVPMLVALVVLSWPTTARLVRGQVLQLRNEAFVQAARLFGSRATTVLIRHILPNVLGILMVAYSFAVPTAIFAEAFLSFIGLGVSPPASSWGAMCNDGMRTLLSTPHQLLFPALMISVTVLAFNLLGDALRDALDAKLPDA